MKTLLKYFSGLIILLLCFTDMSAQGGKSNENSLLWKISKGGSQQASYLFGTIHMICKDDYIWTPKLDECMKKADKICMEMDLDDPNLMTQVAAQLIDLTGKTLKDYFTQEEYDALAKYMSKNLNQDINQFSMLKPVVLVMLLASAGDDECKENVSYELNMVNLSKELGKEIVGLESAAEQIEALSKIPTDSIIKDITAMVNGRENNSDADMKAMVAAYKAQDIKRLQQLVNESNRIGPGINFLLTKRNENWIPRITRLMSSGSIFFAVGAGHLGGKDGVIALLRKSGYTVEPVQIQ